MRRFFLIGVLNLAACSHPGSLYQVSALPNGGVPFLPIESVDTETSTYEQPWLELDVTGKFKPHTEAGPAVSAGPRQSTAAAKGVPESPDTTFTRTIAVYTRDLSPATVELVRRRYADFIGAANAAKAWDGSGVQLLNDAAPRDGRPGPLSLTVPDVARDVNKVRRDLVRVAAESTRTQVPAARPLYYNVQVPRGGTANAEIDLASNGTMTKATSQKEDKLPGAVLSAVSSVASGVLGSSSLNTLASHFFAPAVAPPKLEGAGGLDVLAVDFAVVPVRRLYTITIAHPSGMLAADCGDTAELLDGASPWGCRASLTISVVPPGARVAGDHAETRDPNRLGFSGSVTLPEAGKGSKVPDKEP